MALYMLVIDVSLKQKSPPIIRNGEYNIHKEKSVLAKKEANNVQSLKILEYVISWERFSLARFLCDMPCWLRQEAVPVAYADVGQGDKNALTKRRMAIKYRRRRTKTKQVLRGWRKRMRFSPTTPLTAWIYPLMPPGITMGFC